MCYVDHANDKIVDQAFNVYLDSDLSPRPSDCVLETHINKYLSSVEGGPLYNPASGISDISSWGLERRRLTLTLMEEVKNVRAMSESDRDWDLDSFGL